MEDYQIEWHVSMRSSKSLFCVHFGPSMSYLIFLCGLRDLKNLPERVFYQKSETGFVRNTSTVPFFCLSCLGHLRYCLLLQGFPIPPRENIENEVRPGFAEQELATGVVHRFIVALLSRIFLYFEPHFYPASRTAWFPTWTVCFIHHDYNIL